MKAKAKKCGCPGINEDDWELKETEWKDTLFYTTRIPMFFHVPLGFAGKLRKAKAKMAEKGYVEAIPHTVMLRDGLFSGTVLIGVEPVENTAQDLETIRSGPIVTKVYKRGEKSLSKTVAELLSYIRSKTGVHPKEVFFWFVTCDECLEEDQARAIIIAKL